MCSCWKSDKLLFSILSSPSHHPRPVRQKVGPPERVLPSHCHQAHANKGIHLLIGILSLIFAVVTLYNIKLVTVAVSWCFLIKLNKMTPLGSHLFNISFKLCVYWNTSHVWLKLLKMIADFASKYILKKALLAQFSGGKNTNVLRWKGTSHQKHTT